MNRLVAVPSVGPSEPAAPAADWTRSERLFRRAARHSRFIRILRVMIPLAGVLSCSSLVAVAYFNPFKADANIALEREKLNLTGRKVAMEQPRLTGYTKDSLPYELTARLASQDLKQPGVLELNDLKAQLQTKAQGQVALSADSGIYTIKADQLRLIDNVLLTSSKGYEARLEEAAIDIKKGTVVSDHPVKTRFPQGTLEANRLDVSDSGAVVLFSNGVKAVLTIPEKSGDQAKASP